jgi:pimeloyl-ACP methyl ester carboxylesterase
MNIRELTASVEIFNTRVSYSEIGQGEAYLALHANPGSKRDFLGILEGSERELGAERRLIMLDRPGHNGSEELLSAEPNAFLDAETYARFIDLKCDGKAWLVGYSFGAYVALKVAARFPEKVRGLILLSPFVLPEGLKRSSLPSLSKNALMGTFFGIVKPLLAQKTALQRVTAAFSPVEPSAEYLETWLPRLTRFETLLAEAVDNNQMLETHKEVFEALKGRGDEMPVRVLFGADDALINVETQKKALLELFAHAQITTEAGAGHALPLNNPNKCLELINM